jgi:hypothetical protein
MRRPTAAIFKLNKRIKEPLSENELLNIYKYIEYLENSNRRLETKVNCRILWEKWNGGNKGKTV